MMMNLQQHKQGGTFSPKMLRLTTGLIGMCLAGYIAGPPIYWHLSESLSSSSSSLPDDYPCSPCQCDCNDDSLLSWHHHQGSNISSFIDCMKHDPDMTEEMERNFTNLLSSELRLKEAEALENQQRADTAILEAKKMVSQFQKEADKCSSGMETCELARERAEEALQRQGELSAMWELRAKQKGWREDMEFEEGTEISDI